MALVRHDTDLWSIEYQFGWQRGLVQIPVRMTVIRLGSGQLILHSPVPISPALRDELAALGPVGFIVVPNAHGRFAEQAFRIYSSAQLLAAPAPPARRESLPFRGSLADQPPAAWAGEVESRLVLGFRLQEVVLFHRPSRTLVLTDLCFNIQRSSSWIARAFFRANDMWQLRSQPNHPKHRGVGPHRPAGARSSRFCDGTSRGSSPATAMSRRAGGRRASRVVEVVRTLQIVEQRVRGDAAIHRF
jgi:hypothetical protein